MKRLTHLPHRSSDFCPIYEKIGNISGLPSNKKIALHTRSSGLTYADLSARGIKYVNPGFAVGSPTGIPGSGRTTNPGRDYTSFYANNQLGGKACAQWTQTEAYNYGKNYIGGEGIITEQLREAGPADPYLLDWRGTNAQKVEWVYEGIRDAALAANPKGVLIGSYDGKYPYPYYFMGDLSNSALADALASPSAARAGIPWFTRAESHYTAPIAQCYLFNPGRRRIYDVACAMQRLQLACQGWANTALQLGCWMYCWWIYEGPSDGVVAFDYQWATEQPVPTGKFFPQAPAHACFYTALTHCLNALVFCDGIYNWAANSAASDADPTRISYDHPSNDFYRWKPNVEGTFAPPSAAAPAMPGYNESVYNAPIVAGEFYAEMAAAGGQNWAFTRYKRNSGAYIEPASGALLNNPSLLQAGAAERGYCITSTDGANNYAIIYINPYGPPAKEIITVDLGGGKSVMFDVFANEPVCLSGSYVAGQTLTRLDAFRTT